MEQRGDRKEIVTSHEDQNEEEEARAKIEAWKYIFGFVEMAVVKCAIELGIVDAMEAHAKPITLSDLSAALGCPSSSLHRIMRFLVHLKFLKENCKSNINGGGITKCYSLTPLARLFMSHGERSMKDFLLLESSAIMLAPWQALSTRVKEEERPAFEIVHGEDLWMLASGNPTHSKLFNDAMACDSRVVAPALVTSCADVFQGIGTMVDVGGGNGTMLSLIVKAFPWIKGINFDLPHVASVAPEINGLEHVGGDMFKAVPMADATFLKWVLHDWGDEECIEILRKCREAVPKEKGKVIIVDAVIEEDDQDAEGIDNINDENNYKIKGVRLMLDMVIMAHTNRGKERTQKEWAYVLKEAGFKSHFVRSLNPHVVQSVIVAYS